MTCSSQARINDCHWQWASNNLQKNSFELFLVPFASIFWKFSKNRKFGMTSLSAIRPYFLTFRPISWSRYLKTKSDEFAMIKKFRNFQKLWNHWLLPNYRLTTEIRSLRRIRFLHRDTRTTRDPRPTMKWHQRTADDLRPTETRNGPWTPWGRWQNTDFC